MPGKLTLVLGRNYGQLSDFNARMYLQAVELQAGADKRTKDFKNLVYADAVKQLDGEPTEYQIASFPFQGNTFWLHMKPSLSVSYSGIVDAFGKPAPDKITKKSKFGDLAKAVMVAEGGEEMLKEKGLVDDVFMRDYSPVQRQGATYIRLEGVQSRLKGYSSDSRHGFVSTRVDKSISMLPHSAD